MLIRPKRYDDTSLRAAEGRDPLAASPSEPAFYEGADGATTGQDSSKPEEAAQENTALPEMAAERLSPLPPEASEGPTQALSDTAPYAGFSAHDGAPKPNATEALPGAATEALPTAASQPASEHHDARKRPNFVSRMASHWYDRLMGAVRTGTLSGQAEEYASGRTARDYIWNTLGVGTWGFVFPLLTIVVTRLCGVEQAGMFSLAFITGLMLMFVANYGVRTYQVSDVNEEHTFAEYQANRLITCLIMVACGALYCVIRGYEGEMLLISAGVYAYKLADGLADVYEGRLQQMDKLYLAGISQTLRSVAAVVVFCVALFLTRNLPVACIAMAVAAFATFVLVTFPLAFFETPRSKGLSPESVWVLLKRCFPLFVALFMYNLIDNMPKFLMEGALPYDAQLYFNALYFPAHAILLVVGFIYKPLLLRLANAWADPAKRRRFDLVIIGIMVVIVAITAAMVGLMGWIGLPIMTFLYGVDFEPYRGLCYVMLAAGGVTAAIDFLYQVITVLRRQSDVTKIYLITFGFSLFVPVLLIQFTGLPGAVIGYLIVMAILLVLLVWEYLRIRMEFARADSEAAAAAGSKEARERARDVREQREAARQEEDELP